MFEITCPFPWDWSVPKRNYWQEFAKVWDGQRTFLEDYNGRRLTAEGSHDLLVSCDKHARFR